MPNRFREASSWRWAK